MGYREDDESDSPAEVIKYAMRSNTLTIASFLISIVIVLAVIYWRSMDAEVCVTAQDSDGQPLTGCSIDFFGLKPDPKPEEGEETCSGPGKYYFDDVPIPDDPEYELSVTCYEFTRKSRVLLLDHEIASVHAVFQGSRISGKFYALESERMLTPSRPHFALLGQVCRAQGKVICQPLTEGELRTAKVIIPDSCKGLVILDGLTLSVDSEKLRKLGNDATCKIGLEFPKQYVEFQILVSWLD